MSESKFYHFSSNGLFYGVSSVKEAITASKEGGYIWLNFYNPTAEELHSLIDTMGVHPLSVEDCLDSNQVPKIEQFPDNTFIIFNAFNYTDKTLLIDETDLFLWKNFLITVSGIQSEGRKPLDGVINIVNNDTGLARTGPAFLMQIVLDYIVDEKLHAID